MEYDVDGSSLQRTAALQDLVDLRKPVREAVAALSRFDFDSDEELVTLTPSAIVSVLERYLAGVISALDVEEWAEALFGRDDVGLLAGSENLLKEAVFELSTPEINDPISRGLAARWIARLVS